MKSLVSLVGGATLVVGHPITKVVELLKHLRTTAREEGEEEELSYGKYERWCGNTIGDLKDTNANSRDTIETLKDRIEGLTATIEGLDEEITQLGVEIGERTTQAANEQDRRNSNAALHSDAKDDLDSTIKAIETALDGLQSAQTSTAGLLQVRKVRGLVAASLSTAQKVTFSELLDEPEISGTGKVRKYDFKSNNVIELLKGLRDDFKEQLLEATKAETSSINQYELAKQAQEEAVSRAAASKNAKEGAKGNAGSDKANAESDLSAAETKLADDEKLLSETTSECQRRSDEMDTRRTSRQGELDAIQKAIDILNTHANNNGRELRTEMPSFIQLSRVPIRVAEAQQKAMQLLAQAAKMSKSAQIQRIYAQLKTGAMNPTVFKQVKNQIQKMIFHLNKEQTDEDTQKHWCDQEIESTEQSQSERTAQVKELTTKQDKQQSRIKTLEKEIKQAEEDVKDTNQRLVDREDFRFHEKKDNAVTLEDAQKGQKALQSALQVLTNYYKESGELTKESWEAFIQVPGGSPDADFLNDAHTTSAGSGQVLQILQTCLEDFSSLEANVRAEEEAAENAYVKEVNEARVRLAKLNNEVKLKGQQKTQTEDELASTSESLKKRENQLEALNIYHNDLDPACGSGQTKDERDQLYEQRKGLREKETTALKDALDILKNAFNQPAAAAGAPTAGFLQAY